jgi:hypothetical protein
VNEAALLNEEQEARQLVSPSPSLSRPHSPPPPPLLSLQVEEAVKMRRRFKRQQKEILESLRLKKEEEERRVSPLGDRVCLDPPLPSDQRGRRERGAQERETQTTVRNLSSALPSLLLTSLAVRNEKLLRRKEKGFHSSDTDQAQGLAAGSGVAAVRASRSQGEVGIQSMGSDPHDSETKAVLVASSHAKISQRSHSTHAAHLVTCTRTTSTVREVSEEEGPGGTEAEDREREEEVKKANMKRQQEKVQAHLASLAEKKREESDKARRKEERSRKRAQLLTQRVQAEMQERRLMAREDKYSNPGNVESLVTKPEHHPPAQAEGAVPKKKITPEMAEAIAARLSARQAKALERNDANQPQARDFNDWKRKNAVPSESRVFCMTGWYPCVKTALLQRGWYFNPDSSSPFFDLKWTLRSSDISESLQPWQLTNHFLKNIALTTKVGLLKSLQQLVWLDDVSAVDILPRGYDLSNPQEIQEYLDDFRVQEAECQLKRLYFRVTGVERLDARHLNLRASCSPSEAEGERSGEEGQQSSEEVISAEEANEEIGPVPSPIIDLNQLLVNEAVFSACLSVLSRYQRPFYQDDHLDQELQAEDHYAVSALEWELIESYDLFKAHTLPENGPEPIDEFLQERRDALELNSASTALTSKQRQAQQLLNRQRRDQRKNDQHLRAKKAVEIKTLRPLRSVDLETMHLLLCRCALINSTQNSLNGRGATAKNMWIVKPAAKSRGRGITTFNNLTKLLNYVELGRVGSGGRSVVNTSSHWIVQKYMEDSLIIANRKFDLRQWVLVVDWNPLTIYFYDECYCRFSVEEYTISDEGMDNSFVHLVNNSIGKNSENFDRVVVAENGDTIEGYMWSYESFCRYLHFRNTPRAASATAGAGAESGSDVVAKIRKRMKDIAIWALMSGSDHIEHRKNSWELYGFDYMIDDEFVPWLIEINSSPACDYSTKVTERYVQKALVELLCVVLDAREWESLSKRSKETTPCPDTGGWEKIYQGPFLETPSASFGTDISIKGEVMRLPKTRRAFEQESAMSPISPQQSGPIVKGYSQQQQPKRSAGNDEAGTKKTMSSVGVTVQDRKVRSLPSKQTQSSDPKERKGEMGGEKGEGGAESDDCAGGKNVCLNDSDSDEEGAGHKRNNRRSISSDDFSREGRPKGGAIASGSSQGTTSAAHKVSKKMEAQGLSSIPIKTFAMEL